MTGAPRLKVAFQMDPVEHIGIEGDSSFVLALEAQRRGHEIYHYLPQDLSLLNGRLTARVRPLSVRREKGNHHTYGEAFKCALEEFDLILMRQDPPFDMAYITATHLLEHLDGRTLVLNDPKEVRNAPEKLLVTHFSAFMPETLISRDREEIAAFRKEYGEIILKPLHANGGFQIFHIKEGDDNFNALLEMFSGAYREPFMAQRYIPAIRQGDKRIILIDGEPAGAVMRVPPEGEARANLHVGGRAEKTALTPREYEICEAIGPELRRRGLVFTGIDVIGDFLTEINVTSPTGLQEINRLDGVSLESRLWDAYERRLAEQGKEKQ